MVQVRWVSNAHYTTVCTSDPFCFSTVLRGHERTHSPLSLFFSLFLAIPSQNPNFNTKATPTFEYGFYLPDGTLATKVTNVVAIRPQGYLKGTTPPAQAAQFSAPRSLERLDALLREKILMRVTSKYLRGEALLNRSFEELVKSVAVEREVVTATTAVAAARTSMGTKNTSKRDGGGDGSDLVVTRANLHALLHQVEAQAEFGDSEVDAIFDLLDRDQEGAVSVARVVEWWAGDTKAAVAAARGERAGGANGTVD